MFDNVSRATELANDIREMWGRWQQLEALRDGYRRNFDHRGGMAYQYRMDELQERINECRVQWQAETGKRWRPDYYNLPPTDDVMEKAFAALADALEARDEELLQEVVDVLTVWRWIKSVGGELVKYRKYHGEAILFVSDDPQSLESVREFAAISQAAEWVRQQEGYA